jgi:hypothetical protein
MIALLQSEVLRLAESPSDGISMRPAGVSAINGNGSAGSAQRHHLAASGAFAQGCTAGDRFARVIISETICPAGANRERPRGIAGCRTAD